jgi:glycyl-tRNA synthetase beta chain
MELPPEVLATAMRTHQKYFSCLKPEPAPAKAGGSLAPRFLFVANNLTPDDGKTIVAGNERVLRARLADARFFWEQDRKVRLEDRVEALKDRVYYEKLGSVYERTERLKQIAFRLAVYLQLHMLLTKQSDSSAAGNAGDPMWAAKLAERAAALCKADLSTGMVGEFPELQGIMGRYYALYAGNEKEREDPAVADAIAEHYKPLGPNDICPTAPLSIVLALADKFESLVGFFAIDEKPTGSRDPFALRRAALGIIRLILENNLRLPLRHAVDYASNAFGETNYGVRDIKPDLLAFIADRLKVHLREQGVRHDLISAVFALNEDDLVRLLARVDALQNFLGTEDGASLLIAYRRGSNIVGIEERKGGWVPGNVDPMLLREHAERDLNRALDQSVAAAQMALAEENFEGAMAALATLRRPVDEFFEKVTVNTDAEEGRLRENRLRLLSRIRAVMNQVADFSQIEG